MLALLEQDQAFATADALISNRPAAILSVARALAEAAARSVYVLDPALDPSNGCGARRTNRSMPPTSTAG